MIISYTYHTIPLYYLTNTPNIIIGKQAHCIFILIFTILYPTLLYELMILYYHYYINPYSNLTSHNHISTNYAYLTESILNHINQQKGINTPYQYIMSLLT